MRKKYKGLLLLFTPYDYFSVCRLAQDKNMTVCQYIHWLLNYEIEADADKYLVDCNSITEQFFDYEE